MSIFTKAFVDLWNKVPEVRAKIRVNRTVIEQAICEGQNHTRGQSDQGQTLEAGFFVRCLAADEDATDSLIVDRLCDVQFAGSENWKQYRIAARKETAGMLMLTMDTPHE